MALRSRSEQSVPTSSLGCQRISACRPVCWLSALSLHARACQDTVVAGHVCALFACLCRRQSRAFAEGVAFLTLASSDWVALAILLSESALLCQGLLSGMADQWGSASGAALQGCSGG